MQATQQIDWTQGGVLEQRCLQLGVSVVVVDMHGAIRARHVSPEAWLARLVTRSAIFARALAGNVGEWAGLSEFKAQTLWPGCWVAPLPLRKRRRNVGYRVAVFFTSELFDSEQFARLVDAARLDVQAAKSMVRADHLTEPQNIQCLTRILTWMADDIDAQQSHGVEIDTLSQQLAETYEELSLVYKFSASMTVTQEPGAFLEDVLMELQEVVGVRWMVMKLTDADERLRDLRGKLIVGGEIPTQHRTLDDIAARLLSQSNSADKARIVSNTVELDIPHLTEVAERLLFVPVICENKPLGVLLAGDKIDGSELSSVDSKLVTSLAQNIGIFLENAMLYEDLQSMFMGTLRSLVSAIDAKDTYTCGHSERVAYLSRSLAEAAGLDRHSTERVYLAGMLHDVGKIGVPESVLTKPGRLTDEEFAIIKTHPRLGARIVEGIRQMQDLIPGVLYHHERYDGKGYPDGLAGENIPLMGRLLCLADSFDAMSSSRTYRQALPLKDVLDEITRCAGTQFDPKLAAVFVNLDFDQYQDMIRSDKDRESLLRRELGGRLEAQA